ncbi:type IV pilus biogenesis protein PilP [Rosenbergiella nectarea]|uniref:type IV pilus biogenesis protein PilP n=1 Tax=Rosenbergiella nectarea TaxID=988801 RepID=UPI001F4D9026|nr:type IV pilus biogenesis protein PilP [Rosenbergiella nectarea]
MNVFKMLPVGFTARFLAIIFIGPASIFYPSTLLADEQPLTLGQLEKLQAETLLYEAQLNHDKALAALNTQKPSQPSVSAATADTHQSDRPPMDSNTEIQRHSSQSDKSWQVIEVTGNRYKIVAALLLPSGAVLSVTRGTVLPNSNFHIENIGPTRVTARDTAGHVIILPFKR